MPLAAPKLMGPPRWTRRIRPSAARKISASSGDKGVSSSTSRIVLMLWSCRSEWRFMKTMLAMTIPVATAMMRSTKTVITSTTSIMVTPALGAWRRCFEIVPVDDVDADLDQDARQHGIGDIARQGASAQGDGQQDDRMQGAGEGV